MNSNVSFILFAILAASPLLASVRVTAREGDIPAGEWTVVTATWEGAAVQPDWSWRITPAWAGSLAGLAPGQVEFRPAASPFLALEVTVEAWPAQDRGAAQGTVIRVRPENQAMDQVASIIQGYLGHHPFQPREVRMEFLAGHRGAGHPAPDPATFTNFFMIGGMAWAGKHPDRALRGRVLVADTLSGKLLAMAPDGGTEPWLGDPQGRVERGRSGAWEKVPASLVKDGRGTSARFDGPTAIAVRSGQWDWQAAIIDKRSLRLVDGTGNVTTLLPDIFANPACAGGMGPLFNALRNPVALAYGPDGTLYLASNRVIYRYRAGTMAVHAGSLRHPGPFAGLRGMAADPETGNLWVTDGHGLKRVSPGGGVRLMAGAGQAGFEQWLDQPLAAQGAERMAGVPCFDRPGSVAVFRGLVIVADNGNRAIRVFDPVTGELRTLAGGPGGATLLDAECLLTMHLALNEDGDGVVAIQPDQAHDLGKACFILRLTLPEWALWGAGGERHEGRLPGGDAPH